MLDIKIPCALALTTALVAPCAASACNNPIPPSPPVPVPGPAHHNTTTIPIIAGVAVLGVLLTRHHHLTPAVEPTVAPIPSPPPATKQGAAYVPFPATTPTPIVRYVQVGTPCRTLTPAQKKAVKDQLQKLRLRHAKPADYAKMREAWGACNVTPDEITKWVDPQ